MDKYQNFELNDFVWDSDFRSWVLNPTREDDVFWQNWIVDNQDKQPLINLARTVVQNVSVNSTPLSTAEKSAAINQIIERLSGPNKKPVRRYLPIKTWASIAACLLIAVVFAIYTRKTDAIGQVNYADLIEKAEVKLVEKVNNSSSPVEIKLTDGSTILLNPNSKVSYPPVFEEDSREVFLSGEAFFNVAKKPAQPFYVYSNELVTKVLGTSFFIRSFSEESEVSVRVKTGRVAVFTRNEPTTIDKSHKELTGTVIDPNQEIIVSRANIKMTKRIISQPEIVMPSEEVYDFDFDELPVSKVLLVLQKAYGIEIIYDKNLMYECPITANLTEMSLYEKLDLLCKAIGANYELIDGKIIIEGKGCSK